jgi:hypothetical protein
MWNATLETWQQYYGPCRYVVSDPDSSALSHEVQLYLRDRSIQYRPNSPMNKGATSSVEVEMRFINAMMAKIGDVSQLHELPLFITGMAQALNSRPVFSYAGFTLSAYAFIRGRRALSFAEINAGFSLDTTLSFETFLKEQAFYRDAHVKSIFESRKVPFIPQDISPPIFPEKMPIGSLVWVSPKALPNDYLIGTTKTRSKAAGPFEIMEWQENGVTAYLKDVSRNSDDKYLRLNVQFLRPVGLDKNSYRFSDEYEIESIVGERLNRKGDITHLLVKWKGYGIDHVSEVSLDKFYAEHLLNEWKAIDSATRKKITTDTKDKVKAAKKNASVPAAPVIPKKGRTTGKKPKVSGPLRNVGPNMLPLNSNCPMTRSKSRKSSSSQPSKKP